MPLEHVTDHGPRALDRLIWQFKGKPRFAALITSYTNQIQQIEDAAWDVLLLRAIDNPNTAGAQLDVIGRIVGQARQGMSDVDYRVFLSARVRVNKSSGKAEELIEITSLLVSGKLLIRETYPKSFEIEATEQVTVNARVVAQSFLERAKPRGTRLQFIASPASKATTFTWGDAGGATTDGLGFGDAAGAAVGGVLASVYA